jgi:hypothetical protein
MTGRDQYIQAQALAYFIAVQDALPLWRQQRSNRLDAARLLLSSHRDFGAMLLGEARRALRQFGEPDVPEATELTPELVGKLEQQFKDDQVTGAARLAELQAEVEAQSATEH